VRKLITLTLTAALAVTGAAAAATAPGTITATLNPAVVKHASTFQLSAVGPFAGSSGLPQQLVIDVQKGFQTSTKAVMVECTEQQEKASPPACPKGSEIGHGTIALTVNLGLAGQVHTPASMFMYLGQSANHADIASVELVITNQYLSQPYAATGRLYHTAGGTELKFANFSTATLPPGVSPSAVTVDSMYFTVGASTKVVTKVTKGKGKKRKTVKKTVTYSLITNPATCHTAWTGSFALTMQNGSIARNLSVPCKKK
jgi:hypothetical protein